MQQQAKAGPDASAAIAVGPEDMPDRRSVGDNGASPSSLAHSLDSLSFHPSPNLNSGTYPLGPKDAHSSSTIQAVGSHLSLQSLDPVHDQTLDPPAKNSELLGLDPSGRTPGGATAASRHMTNDNLIAAPMAALDINSGKEPNLDDCLEPAFQPRALVINNLIDTVTDEDLQKDLESYGDVSTLYTATKSQGQVMVTFYSSIAAARAFAALQGRNINGRELQVDFHFSLKDSQAGRVFLFDVKESVTDQHIIDQMSAYGSIMLVRPHPTVPRCREVLYHDTRAAQQAFNAIYHQSGGVPTISEDGTDPQPPIHMGLRSNHSHQSFGSLGVAAAQDGQYDWSQPQNSWEGTAQAPHLGQMVSQAPGNSNQDMLALLNQSSPSAIENLVRQGYLPNPGSSASLGPSHGLGSSAALRGLDSQAGSSANLGGLTSSASHPDLAAAFLQNDSPEHSGSLPLGSNQSLSQLTGSGNLTAGQVAALHSSGLLGSLGSSNIARGRRGMSTPDLTQLPNAMQGSSNNLQALSKPMWNGGQYNPSELSGWGSNLNNNYPNANLDTAALLAAQGGLALGGFGAMQRSMSALQLHQMQQSQQQQQLLLQLAGVNPQAFAQLSNMRLGGMPPHSNSHPNLARNKSHRSDDNLAGGRLSRRAADPTVEAERRAQQDRQFALDEAKVLSGEDTRTTLMIKNIPNKYTQKMLLQTIDEQFNRLYDFFYLPIDFKNKCNVGYAFINMVQPKYILPLTKRFNQRKWERFNSEKVCHISYARIQGKNQLITHFQNSSLLHEDKRCRPILFKSEGDFAGEQEPFPTSTGNRSHRNRPFSAGPDAS